MWLDANPVEFIDLDQWVNEDRAFDYGGTNLAFIETTGSDDDPMLPQLPHDDRG